MTKVLLADDEPLTLIGMQSLLDWVALGYEIVGTAHNGAEALQMIEQSKPDIVVSDIRMPVMDGLALAERCREQDDSLPVFIMLTSFEEYDYVRRSISVGAVEYLVKIDLTTESLTAALERAREKVNRVKAVRTPAGRAGSVENYRDRFFLQLYSGTLPAEVIATQSAELGLSFTAQHYVVAIACLRSRIQDTEQLVTLSAGVSRMAADVLGKYRPCTVTPMDLRHFLVLFSLQSVEEVEQQLAPVLASATRILYNYFNTPIWWAVGAPVDGILEVYKSKQNAFWALPLLTEKETTVFYRPRSDTPLNHRAQLVAGVQDYIRDNLDKRLSLNDVAAVFNFSPSYLSQLFSQSGESGFVEFVTDNRISAAKILMASTDLKIYEISERLGFDSPFYFSKVFKKVEGVSPREYIQRLKGEKNAGGTD